MTKAPFTGRVTCEARIVNGFDDARARRGELDAAAVRSVPITDVVVGADPTTLELPGSIFRRLGRDDLLSLRRPWLTPRGTVRACGPVRFWLGDRDMTLDAVVVADDRPVRVGRSVLNYLQYVVDVPNHRLVPSSANGGQWILDLF